MSHPLEALLCPRWRFGLIDADVERATTGCSVVCVGGAARDAEWLQADGWRIYVRPSAELDAAGSPFRGFRRGDGTRVEAKVTAEGDVIVPFSLAEAYDAYISERWREASSHRRLSERSLIAYYHLRALIPRPTQLAARRWLIRLQGVPEFPAWPLDRSVATLARFFAECALRAAGLDEGEFAWFWPGGRHAAVILTHDVESTDGIRRVLDVADVEEERGFRSSFNFGAWYDVDPGVLRELRQRGFEIGMHGLTHDRQLFASRAAFEERLPALRDLANRLGAVGFRSPATHRVYDWLGELPTDYDCTLPHSDPYEPQPGGCCSVWPFLIGPVVELPYTLPQDHTLLTLLKHRTPDLWLRQAEAVKQDFGLIQCVSHPDAGYLGDSAKLAVYAAFLDAMAEDDAVWRALPCEVASWWRRRAAADEPPGIARLTPAGAELMPPA